MRDKRVIYVGDKKIGGDNDIVIQSMTNTKTNDVEMTINQINELDKAGCDVVRCAITSLEDARSIPEIKKATKIPIIGDIQYDYKLALAAIENKIDGLRLNPGNIGGKDRVKEIVNACKKANISIRVGVNAGSLSQKFLDKYGGVNEKSMVYSALEQVKILEELNFNNIKISLKASSVDLTVKANKMISEMVDYPLHLGVTEAGSGEYGIIKSSVGLGILLSQGIGDTIRVSLTGDPVKEIEVAQGILRSLGLYKKGIEIISCPTCARTNIDLISLVKEAEKRFKGIDKNLQVAIMGCAVNGPGEAREADIGIAAGVKEGIIFKRGKIVKKVKESELLEELILEMEDLH